MRRMSSFCCRLSSFCRMLIWARLAVRMSVSRASNPSTFSATRARWSATSRKYGSISGWIPVSRAPVSTRIGCPSGPTAWRNSTACRLSEQLRAASAPPDRVRDGAVGGAELDALPLERVDPGGVGAPLRGEDLRLELLQLQLDVVGDLLVVVDDGVADAVEHGRGPVAQQITVALETAANRFEDRVAAVLNRDHEVLPGEQHDLAGDQLGPGLVVVQRLEHDEQAFVVNVEFGPLVGVDRVLDRQWVRREVQREVVELVVGRLVQPEPSEAARHATGLPDCLGHADRLPLTVGVERAVDKHSDSVVPEQSGVLLHRGFLIRIREEHALGVV